MPGLSRAQQAPFPAEQLGFPCSLRGSCRGLEGSRGDCSATPGKTQYCGPGTSPEVGGVQKK